MRNLRYMTIFPVLLILASVAAAWQHYYRVKAEMVRDLNQALERVVTSSADMDGVLETLPLLHGSPTLTFGGKHTALARQLQIATLRDTACISYSMATGEGQVEKPSPLLTAGICSDTIMLARRTADGTDIAVAVKAYAHPTLASIISQCGGTWTGASFVAGVLMLCLMLMAQRMAMKTPVISMAAVENIQMSGQADTTEIPRGLSLTPMQQQLLTLFYASPSRTLSKEEICATLWPRKDNPEDGLYTFISRMKAALSAQSALRIVNRRGREYILVDETGTNAHT